MFKKLGDKRDYGEYSSFYELDSKRACELEAEFKSKEFGHRACLNMYFCVFVGILCFVPSIVAIMNMIVSNICNNYLFILLFFLVVCGSVLIVFGTMAYQAAFSSWLEVKYKIIKK